MIRRATMDDLPVLAKIEQASFDQAHYPIDSDTFYELFMDPRQVILVAETAQHGVVGYLLAEMIGNKESLSIDSVAVFPEHRGNGLGRELVETALELSKNNQIHHASLETPEADKKLQDFYSGLGFTPAGRQDDFYADGTACVIMKIALMIILLLVPLQAFAQELEPPVKIVGRESAISLQLPVDCVPGKTCWLVHYPDADHTAGSARDFTCGPLSYDTHDGTDFGILDLVTMETGVSVKAAASGKVLRFRDGAEDTAPSQADIQTLLSERKGCGNGVIIDHGQGWQTIYCHMKKDSIKIKDGQPVQAGDILGQVGHSGIAEFPHLHFTVFHDGTVIDPFTGTGMDQGCGATETAPLWSPPLPYEDVSFYAAGFKTTAPDIEALKVDTSSPQKIRRGESDILTFWVLIYGAALDDKIHMEIIGPDGQTYATRDFVQDKTRARHLYYVGKRFGEKMPSPGTYTGVITLSRTGPDGKVLIRTHDATVIID